jgi:hypothetical protein
LEENLYFFCGVSQLSFMPRFLAERGLGNSGLVVQTFVSPGMYNRDPMRVLTQPGLYILTDAAQTLQWRRQVCGPTQLSYSFVMAPGHSPGLR